jgi:hypothetical protein
MTAQCFDLLILIGRPASGKSEIIDFLINTPIKSRLNKFHIGNLYIIDDFPMIWTWFEEDKILSERLGAPRIHTDENNNFKHTYQWHLLIERINLEYEKFIRDQPESHDPTTVLIEFARGSEHGGYEMAFSHLSEKILSRAAILYVSVSYEESLRKNAARFNPNRPDSILEHALPDEKLERLYREDDWREFCRAHPNLLTVKSYRVPYVNFENEDNITDNKPKLLEKRLGDNLSRLWDRWFSGKITG